MVPKKGDLFLQRPPGVDHAVDPVRLPRPVCVGVVQLEVVPPEQSVVDFRKALGVQEIVDKLFVRDLYKLIKLVEGCAKSGPGASGVLRGLVQSLPWRTVCC